VLALLFHYESPLSRVGTKNRPRNIAFAKLTKPRNIAFVKLTKPRNIAFAKLTKPNSREPTLSSVAAVFEVALKRTSGCGGYSQNVPESDKEVVLPETADAKRLWADGLAGLLYGNHRKTFDLVFGAIPRGVDSISEGNGAKLSSLLETSELPILDSHHRRDCTTALRLINEPALQPALQALTSLKEKFANGLKEVWSRFRLRLSLGLTIDPDRPTDIEISEWAGLPSKRRKRAWMFFLMNQAQLTLQSILIDKLRIVFKALMQEVDPKSVQRGTPYAPRYLCEFSRKCLEDLSDPNTSASSEIHANNIDPAVLSIQECFEDLLSVFNIFTSASTEPNFGVLAMELIKARMDNTGTDRRQDQAAIKRERISVANLKTLAQFLLHGGVELQHLSDTSLPSHMIKVANSLYTRATNRRRRPATDGIDLEVFLYVILHSLKRGMLTLPLPSIDDGLDPSAVQQLQVFWREQQLDKTYAELDLQKSAYSACEDKSNAWRNLHAGARIVVIGQIDGELAGELDQLTSSDSDAQEVPNDGPGRETGTAGKNEGPRCAPRTTPAGTGQREGLRRRRTYYRPKGIPNIGSTCYVNCTLQVFAALRRKNL